MIKLSKIPGIGVKAEEALTRLNIKNSTDLLWHFPSNIINKKLYPSIYDLKNGDIAILRVTILNIDSYGNKSFSRSKSFKIYCSNSTGNINLVFFNYYPEYILNWVKTAQEIIVIGKVEFFNGSKQIAHPEIIALNKFSASDYVYEVIYPLTYGITNKQIQKYINIILNELEEREEWIDQEIIQKFKWDSFKNSLVKIHHPTIPAEVASSTKYRMRIAYDELLANQLAVGLLRQYKNSRVGRQVIGDGKYLDMFYGKLPFTLTLDQNKAIKEILSDQQSCNKMSRLLQGDVGSGKTVVAMAAMINVVEAKFQAVLMVPTDVLANQHFNTMQILLKDVPIKCALLTGRTKTKERMKILEDLANGDIDILVGTHAVFQEKVVFQDLALVVIDEQHRFGVEQRISLVKKGNNPDLLIMSATPIPRSMSLALYGDMDITRINHKPSSRIPIKTSILSASKVNQIIMELKKILDMGGKIYWICPLITEKEDSEFLSNKKTAVEQRLSELESYYPGIVGIVHGQLDSNAKYNNLNKFVNGEYKILVATTVIEVGVDVPDATTIIIENAESFGLAQLHQLRGRVGRGSRASNCILLYKSPISEASLHRLKALKECDDGFLLAEEDLKIRGGGDIIGVKQSGLPEFKAVDFIVHYELISLAHAQAKSILYKDPFLKTPLNQKYKTLLEIFDYDKEIDLLN